MQSACDNMMDWLCREHGLSMDQAVLLIGARGECRISQCVNATGPTAKVMLTSEGLTPHLHS